MATFRRKMLFIALAMAAVLVLAACAGQDQGGTRGDGADPGGGGEGDPIRISEPWARPVKASGEGEISTGVVYMTIENAGPADDEIIGAASSVAGVLELHETVHDHDEGTSEMHDTHEIPVPAGETVELKPGGLHIMLIDVKQDLDEGDSFSLTLSFREAGDISVTVPVELK